MNQISRAQLAARYIPVAAALLGAALFVAVVPSRPGEQVASGGESGFELPDVASGDESVISADGVVIGADGQPVARSGGVKGAVSQRGGGTGGTGGGPTGAAGFDCSRRALIGGPTCRPPKFTGDNGGATAPGVTKDAITIVTYVPKRNPQVQAILAAAGTASSDQQREVLLRYEKFFNEHYELYGRKIKLPFQEGPGDGADPALAQADAALVASELKAFYVNCASCTTAFHDELARRRVPSTTVIVPFLAEYHEKNAPFIYGVLPDFDLTARSGSEYFCKRMQGRNAVHAGDAALRSQKRKLAIIAIDTPDNAGDRYKKYIESCGGEVALVVKYASDITTAQQQATNIMLQVSQSGANVVTCVCDVIAPVFFTSAATEQQYYPEWFQNGLFAMDSYKAAQLYDTNQWSQAFGVGSISKPDPIADEEWYRAYKAGGGTDETAIKNAGGSVFSAIVQALDAIELAGPKLTVETFTHAMLTMPAYGFDRLGGSHQSFGKNGPGPWTRVDDHGEIWWDPTRTAPNDRPGDYFYVNGGQRYLVGGWPTAEPNVFVDDQSPQ